MMQGGRQRLRGVKQHGDHGLPEFLFIAFSSLLIVGVNLERDALIVWNRVSAAKLAVDHHAPYMVEDRVHEATPSIGVRIINPY